MSSLSIDNDINANYIAGFAPIAARSKIWLLKGFLDDDLVLKYEQSVTTESLKPTSQVLKTIDPMARMKALKPGEVLELRKALITVYNLGLDEKGNDFRPQLHELLRAINMNIFTFTKMRVQIMMDLDSALQQRLQGNGDAIGQFASTLAGKNGLEALGEVIVGDLFIGNEDRFEFGMGTHKRKFGNHTYELNCIFNIGNIVLILKNGEYAPSMLDYMDPGNQYPTQDVDTVEKRSNKRWPGRYLLSKELRRSMAEQVVADLENLLCPPGTNGKPKLGKARKERVIQGLESGIRKLILKFQGRGRTGQLPKGIQSRYEWLLTAGIRT